MSSWITLWRTVTIISRLSDTYVHQLLMKLLRWWLVLLLALELITVTHYFRERLTEIWTSYKTEQPELIVVLWSQHVSSTQQLHHMHWLPVRSRIQFQLSTLCFRLWTLNQLQYRSDTLTLIPTNTLAPFIDSQTCWLYLVVKLCLAVVDFRLLHLECGTIYHKNFETVKL